MNETFDIEESESESETKLVQVKLRQNSKRPAIAATQAQPLFSDIDESKKRESILLIENNFNLMQKKNENQNDGLPSNMEFLENELIPDDILDDVYNFSETISTLNGSSNLNGTIGRKSFNKTDTQVSTEESVNNHKNEVENENLDWLSTQIRALETSLDIPVKRETKKHASEIQTSNLIPTYSNSIKIGQDEKNSEDHGIVVSACKNNSNNNELQSQLIQLSKELEYHEATAEASSTTFSTSKTIDFNENEVKCVLNELLLTVCQLNETSNLVYASSSVQNDKKKNIKSNSSVSQQNIHEINFDSRNRSDDTNNENISEEFSNAKIQDAIKEGKFILGSLIYILRIKMKENSHLGLG
jgi:hypothetical protein